jgi:hypothetical protein
MFQAKLCGAYLVVPCQNNAWQCYQVGDVAEEQAVLGVRGVWVCFQRLKRSAEARAEQVALACHGSSLAMKTMKPFCAWRKLELMQMHP